MQQLALFNEEDFLDTTIKLKQIITTIINSYENENSWLYCDTEAMIQLIKMLIIY